MWGCPIYTMPTRSLMKRRGELPISRQSFDVYWQEDERFVLGMLKTVMDDLKHKEVYQYEVGGFRKVTIYANSKVLNSIQVNQY